MKQALVHSVQHRAVQHQVALVARWYQHALVAVQAGGTLDNTAGSLSSNGTLIDENNIDKIAECDFNYVGVSLDGLGATHDKFRRLEGAFVASLMGRVVEPGKFANWIAPPVMGINRQPIDFQYVRFN